MDDKERITRLEERLRTIGETQREFKSDLNQIKNELKDIHDVFVGAKGARWALIVVSTAIGYSLSWVFEILTYMKAH